MAGHDGRIVAANLLDEQKRQTPDYAVVPSVVFTIPPLASVGLLESVARRRDLVFDVHQGDTASWNSSRRVGETHSGFKVLVEKASGRILGAHVLGPHADDVINIFAMAMRNGGTASSLKELLFAYPTAGSDIPYSRSSVMRQHVVSPDESTKARVALLAQLKEVTRLRDAISRQRRGLTWIRIDKE
jgi:glutathione reductase (NADPH)